MELPASPSDASPFLECLFASATEGLLLLNKSGEILQVNSPFCEYTGHSPSDLEGKHLNAFLKEDGRKDLHQLLQSLKPHLPEPGTFQIRVSDGTYHPFQANLATPDGHSDLVCLFCRDSTVGPVAQKQELRLATDAMMWAANAIVISDAKGRILQVNRAFTKYTGYTPDEVLGKTPTILKSGQHSKEFYAEMWNTIQRGEVWQGEIVNRRKNGTLYTEDMTITPIFSEDGEIVNYIAIKQDITDRKELEHMFLRSQRLESVGTLASGVAHDLNNVLSPIIMSADLIMAQNQDEHLGELLSMIKEGAKRGADIVRQLLSFARGGDAGHVEIQVRHILKDQIQIYRETFPKNISIESRLDRELDPVLGDSTQLYQVFANLMINARDAMPEGGNLLVEATNQHVDEAFARNYPFARTGTFARVRIQDGGVGMSEEVQAKVFDSFFTTKTHGKGTGLGLPTSLSIVKNHQGFLILNSTEGEGTTFDVYLPAVTFSGEGDETEKAPEPPKGGGERILVVDDEESIVYMLRGTLVSLGYQVEIATGGKAALDWVADNPGKADFMMIDMMMPGVDGSQVIRTLRESDQLPPTLIMSGMVSDEILESTGIDLKTNYISKPFTIQELAEKLHGLMKKA